MSTPDENTNEISGEAAQSEAASGATAPETSPSHLAETTSAHMSDTSAGMPQATPVVPPVVSPPPAATAPAAPAAPTGYAAAPAAAPAYTAPNPTPNTWMNIVSFVTALLAMGVVAVIFGHLGVSAANKGKAELKGLGIAGLIIGYLTIVFWIIIIALLIGGALAFESSTSS